MQSQSESNEQTKTRRRCYYGPPRPTAIATFLASDDHYPGAQTMLYSLLQHMPSTEKNDNDAKGDAERSITYYPPELIVLVTPNVSREVRDMLCPIYCTRIVDVDYVPMPRAPMGPSSTRSGDNASGSGSADAYTIDTTSGLRVSKSSNGSGSTGKNGRNGSSSHVTAWDTNCGLSKLAIFTLEQYSSLLYIDADCLVVQDVSHLLLGVQDIGPGGDNANGGGGPMGLIAAAPDIFPPDK